MWKRVIFYCKPSQKQIFLVNIMHTTTLGTCLCGYPCFIKCSESSTVLGLWFEEMLLTGEVSLRTHRPLPLSRIFFSLPYSQALLAKEKWLCSKIRRQVPSVKEEETTRLEGLAVRLHPPGRPARGRWEAAEGVGSLLLHSGTECQEYHPLVQSTILCIEMPPLTSLLRFQSKEQTRQKVEKTVEMGQERNTGINIVILLWMFFYFSLLARSHSLSLPCSLFLSLPPFSDNYPNAIWFNFPYWTCLP